MPRVSVIIPTFNRAHVLDRAINSVLNQTYKDFELIVIDDGSTDETDRVIYNYQDKRIFYYKQENRGVSAARNLGILKSKGEWIALLDSDDEWLPFRLSSQITYIQENPSIQLVHGEEIWIRNGKRVNPKKKHQKFGGNIYERCLKLCFISPSSVLIKKSLFNEIGLFDENFEVCEDYDLWLRITSQYNIGLIKDQIIIKYGGHEDQLSQKLRAMDWYRVKSMLKMLRCLSLEDEKRNETIRELRNKCHILQKGYMKHGNLIMKSKIENIIQKLSL
ncbi:MAG: glycosyltransferase [Halobacteriovoraceae bacterium]|nr:glycosyltransferase [Halobacteriovoraceae bacterium]